MTPLYTCTTCFAGYVPEAARAQHYTCPHDLGRLALRTPLDDERDRVKRLRAELAAARVEIRALKAAVQWAGTRARRAVADMDGYYGAQTCVAVCRQLAASDELLRAMKESA